MPSLFYSINPKGLLCQKDLQDLARSLRYGSTRTEDSSHTCLIQEVLVLCRNYTTSDNNDILATQLLKLLDNLRNQSLVACSQ